MDFVWQLYSIRLGVPFQLCEKYFTLSVFTYAFDDLVIPQMIDMETIRQISMKHIKQKYNVDSIEEYHVDIGLYTCAKKLEESWYVVNIYPETSEYDLYSVWINCMTGEIILDDFAKHSLG